jgi:hypothetical protein
LLAIIFSIIASLHRILPIYLILEDGTGSNPFGWVRSFTSSPFLILTLFDEDGVWQGAPTRKILWDGEVIDIDEYAASSGLVLPDA